MMKPLLLASFLVLSLVACGSDDDDPVIREQGQQSTGTPKQPFSASLGDDTASDVPVDPAEGRDIPGGPDMSNQQAQPQFRE